MARHANAEYSRKNINDNFTLLQSFEWYCEGGGKHWKALQKLAPQLCQLGITALWIPPPTKAANPESVGYDIYDHWDLGEFDQKGSKGSKYGTKDELKEMIKTARENGIITYIDAVLNHKFGADQYETFKATEVDSQDRSKPISDPYDIEGWTNFTFSGRNKKYSSMEWKFHHFTGVDFDNKTKKKQIFRILGDGKNWATEVDKENINYDYLMGADIDHSHPEVEKDLLEWGTWVLNETDAQGFRFDAIKHIDQSFVAKFVSHVRSTSKVPKLFAVGEYWKDSLDDLDAYLESFGGQFSLFDAPLHYNFKHAGDIGNQFDIRQIFDGTVVQKRPIDAVTLVENHDTQVGQALESAVAPWFKPLAYSLILLRPDGYPCVFWGDLFGCNGPAGNPQEKVNQLGDIIRARRLFAYGEVRDYWDHPNCIGWVRAGDKHHDGCAVVICNGDEEGVKAMEVGKLQAGEGWSDILGWTMGDIVIRDDGWADFRCPSKSVSIWVKRDGRGTDEFAIQ